VVLDYFRPNIRSLEGYRPGEQPQQGKFIKLNTNENPYPASDGVLRAIGSVDGARLARYPDPHATAFRAVAGTLLGVDEDWILCGNGSDDLLNILVRAFAGEGDMVRFSYPGYILYPTLCHIQGSDQETVPYEKDWSMSDAFTAKSKNIRLAILANPNSPSGTVLEPDQILKIADALPCPLVVDEAYVDFAEENCLKLVKERSNIVVTRSLSKSYSLAGLRFGYLIAQPDVIDRLSRVKDSYNCDTLSIVGATAAISDQKWRAENQEKIKSTRIRMQKALVEMGFQVPDSQANFLWCTHASHVAHDIYTKLKSERILVRYMDFSDWGDGLRVTVGTDQQTDALLELLPTLL